MEHRGEIATRDAEGGVRLYLPGEAPDKDPDETVDMIVGSEEGDSPDVGGLTGDAPPVVIDKKGPHETTEFALVASEGRFWLRNFREDEADRESEYMESPELEAITSEEEVEDESGHEGIEVNDVVEHSSGQRGKVVDKEDGTLIVSTGSDSRNEWSEGACEFIREGNRPQSLSVFVNAKKSPKIN